ncbi:MAG: beta-N-acetylhexosaminidase [Candidatus Marinimicrobia bacterium]|nr:beta-N-acetylhexosaminidase [Candidatus Neomarinimicrobiota bacterium]
MFSMLVFSISFNCNNNKAMVDMNKINVIPKPKSIKLNEHGLSINLLDKIITTKNSDSEIKIARMVQEFISPIKSLPLEASDEKKPNSILITIDNRKEFPIEGYSLSISANNKLEITSSTYAGLFYGYQTFRQLCGEQLENNSKPTTMVIPGVDIVDEPTFKYRGMHLDVSRHFFDIDFIKTYIDMIALHKMNVFHWHLTDDNGWRIEIDKYPMLAEKSAWRVDRRSDPWKEQSPAKKDEKATYGGYYTKEEIREVVEYARSKNIMIIPEIEMPGHTSEVFAAYPELSCKGEYIPVNPGSYWPNVDIFCAGKEEVFEFLQNVLEEIVEMFPGPYIHIGGDEAHKEYWETCPLCQKRITEEGLDNEHELQSWFIKRIEKFIVSKNKKLVGWDEILEGGLAKSATVMSWRGMKAGVESAKAGHDVIMCPTSHCYFDYYQADPENSPAAFGGYTTLKKVYSFNPIPSDLSNSEKGYILGAQGNLWTEYVQTPDRAQYRVLPRMSALSEVLWSGPGKNTYEDFYKRLNVLKSRFDQLGWNYAPGSYAVSITVDQKDNEKVHKIKLTSEKPGETIKYTLDGSEPKKSSLNYHSPIVIDKKVTIKAALFIDKEQKGKTSKKTIYFSKAIGKSVQYNTKYSDRYSGSGPLTLVDGLTGTIAHNDNYWQGWKGQNIDVTIDLDDIKNISKVSVGFLESHGSWIFLPTHVIVSFSTDGLSFGGESEIRINDGENGGPANRIDCESIDLNLSARYVRVRAINRGGCPEWHPGAGSKTWLFSDEIIVE